MVLTEENNQEKILTDRVLDVHHEQENMPSANGKAGEYQADEQAGVARLSWRVSGR